MTQLELVGKNSQKAKYELSKLKSNEKNSILNRVAENLVKNTSLIIKENKLDVDKAKESGIKKSLIDRLLLTEDRIISMAEGLKKISLLKDPIGEVLYMKEMGNGLKIGKKRVPIGVIGIIYESRPNVTVDAFGLCFKTNNAVLLRGGSDAINSNRILVKIVQNTLKEYNLPKEIIQIIKNTDRKTALEMMKMNDYLDLLIPRGGAGLIKSVVQNSTVPVIETGTGNCHVYVDRYADVNTAVKIVDNAKTQRTGVCNACEKLLVHKDIVDGFLPKILNVFKDKKVEVRGDINVQYIDKYVVPVVLEDWRTEYLDMTIAVKVVENIDEAISHINQYGTGHSEAIITESYTNSQKFLDMVDAAAVYVNASTRFTDGEEFGFGAEIGISTQKLHARGPMGLEELTSIKYIIYGSGQIR